MGRVAADNGHKWVFKDSPTENDPSFITTWNVSLDLVMVPIPACSLISKSVLPNTFLFMNLKTFFKELFREKTHYLKMYRNEVLIISKTIPLKYLNKMFLL